MRLSAGIRATLLTAACLLALTAAACSAVQPSSVTAYSQLDLVVGTGPQAASGNTVTVSYTGWLWDPTKPDQKGVVFDTTLGKAPFVFQLGSGSVIQGWDVGIPGMKVGGSRRLIIPPSMAYGSARYGSIPQNATLLFEIELLDVQ